MIICPCFPVMSYQVFKTLRIIGTKISLRTKKENEVVYSVCSLHKKDQMKNKMGRLCQKNTHSILVKNNKRIKSLAGLRS
jgi:hypothetical protein